MGIKRIVGSSWGMIIGLSWEVPGVKARIRTSSLFKTALKQVYSVHIYIYIDIYGVGQNPNPVPIAILE